MWYIFFPSSFFFLLSFFPFPFFSPLVSFFSSPFHYPLQARSATSMLKHFSSSTIFYPRNARLLFNGVALCAICTGLANIIIHVGPINFGFLISMCILPYSNSIHRHHKDSSRGCHSESHQVCIWRYGHSDTW